MNTTTSLSWRQLLSISLTQGICLLLLYRADDLDIWPSESPAWSYPLWSVAIVVPLLLLLSIDGENYRRVAKYVGGVTVALTLLAAYTGFQAEPFGEFPLYSLTFAFAASIGIAAFKALMYLQQRANREPLSYPVLFTNSWRNFLVSLLAGLFTLIFWLILVLWGQLFRVIGIEFFRDLFREDWFVIPVLSVAFGTGILLFRNLTRVIDSITQLLHWLIKLLLPLTLLVAVIFLAALPVAGLSPLWNTGNGTALLLWLLALVLFFTNAVYQDGREAQPYPRLLHRAIYCGLCVAPVLSALAFYGLLLRLQQYGWSVERYWALVTWLILSLFGVGYVIGIVRKRDLWTTELARVNTLMGIVVLAIMLLANSPLMDFRKLSLKSQLARVESGSVSLQEFDFWYAKQHLARPGYLAVERIKAEVGDTDPDLLALIASPARHWPHPVSMEAVWQKMIYRPAAFDVPSALRPLVNALLIDERMQPILVRVDLDEDGTDEYLLITLSGDRRSILNAQYFALSAFGWQSHYLAQDLLTIDDEQLQQLLAGEITLTPTRYRNVNIGGIEFRPSNH